MTTENKSIWHTPEEQPKDFADIVLINSKTGDFASFFTPFHNISFEYDQWAYVCDLVLASKALEVAIDTLKDAAKDTGNEKTLPGMDLYKHVKHKAKQTLVEIDKIMGGDK